MGVEEKRKAQPLPKKKKEETNQRAYTMGKGYSGWKLQEQPNWMNNKKELKTFQRQKIHSSTYKAKEKQYS